MKHAAYCGTRAIYDDMEMSAKSLIANSDVGKVWFLIEDDEFPGELPDIIECVNVSGQTFYGRDGPNMESGFTYMAMMRAALCHVLPSDVDRVLSLDADTVCIRDVSDVWDIDLDGCYFAATPEWHRSKNGLVYCNHGVVLYNLNMMRDGKADEAIHALNVQRFPWVEQDACNYLCQGRIAEMPSMFNSNYWTDKGSNRGARIVHYAGVKRHEWVNRPDPDRWRKKSWGEVMEDRS